MHSNFNILFLLFHFQSTHMRMLLTVSHLLMFFQPFMIWSTRYFFPLNLSRSRCYSWINIPDKWYWGFPHGHWRRIHWIRIPDLDSMWSRVSSTRHETTCMRCTRLDWISGTVWGHCRAARHAQLGSGLRPCGRRVSGSPIHIGSESKVPCGEPLYVPYNAVASNNVWFLSSSFTDLDYVEMYQIYNC